jgi:hypothetical protein
VVLGGTDAPVVSWSDEWVQVTVGSRAISGAVKLQQNAVSREPVLQSLQGADSV